MLDMQQNGCRIHGTGKHIEPAPKFIAFLETLHSKVSTDKYKKQIYNYHIRHSSYMWSLPVASSCLQSSCASQQSSAPYAGSSHANDSDLLP